MFFFLLIKSFLFFALEFRTNTNFYVLVIGYSVVKRTTEPDRYDNNKRIRYSFFPNIRIPSFSLFANVSYKLEAEFLNFRGIVLPNVSGTVTPINIITIPVRATLLYCVV